MKTRPDFHMPHSFVWLLLVAILCVAILPAAAVAKVDRTIATEGDPGDGMDSAGSGGGSGAIETEDISKSHDIESIHVPIRTWDYLIIVPYWTPQGPHFQFEFLERRQNSRRQM